MAEPIEIVTLKPRPIVAIRRTIPQSGLGDFFTEVYPKLEAAIKAGGGAPASKPLARYYSNDPRPSTRSPRSRSRARHRRLVT